MAHASSQTMERLLPAFVRTPVPVDAAAAAIERAVLGRKARTWAPRYVGAALAAARLDAAARRAARHALPPPPPSRSGRPGRKPARRTRRSASPAPARDARGVAAMSFAAAQPPAGDGAALADIALVGGIISAATVAVARGHRRLPPRRRAARAPARRRRARDVRQDPRLGGDPRPAGDRRRRARRSWARSGTSASTSTRAATTGRSGRPRTTRSWSASCGVYLLGVLAVGLAPTTARGRQPRVAPSVRGLGPRAGRRAADPGRRRLRDARLPARRPLAPHLRPGRDAVGADAHDVLRRR